MAQEVLVAHMRGPIHLPKWIVAHPDYDTSNNDKLKALNKEGNERLKTCVYFINSN